jgi:AcrR family transcriptional regulator
MGDTMAGDTSEEVPRNRRSVRATRTAGRRTRSHLLDVATRLFKQQGFNGVAVTAIADAADAFPSQITYYFHSKEALFVEAACRDILHVAKRAEAAAARARTPTTYTHALVSTVLAADGVSFFIEALVLARQRPDLSVQVERTINRLHEDGARAFERVLARRGWQPTSAPTIMSRKFWAILLGVALEGLSHGQSSADMSASMREVLGTMATTA